MLPVVQKHIIDDFIIDKNVKDPTGYSFVKGSVFKHIDFSFIEVNSGTTIRKINTSIQTNTLPYKMNSLEYLNYIRCEAGISYVTNNEIELKPFNLGTIEANSVIEVYDATRHLKKTNYEKSGKIYTQLLDIYDPHFQVPVSPPDFLKYIRAKDDAQTHKHINNTTTQNNMAYNSSSLSNTGIGAYLSGTPTSYTCKNPVTDTRGQTWAAQTTFKKAANYVIDAISTDFDGNQMITTLNLNPHPSNAGYPSAEDYIRHIMHQDSALNVGSIVGGPFSGDGIVLGNSNGSNSIYNNVEDEYNDAQDTSSNTQLTKIKKVYCPYNADIIVYDVHNTRVDELCGKLTAEKFYALISRITDETKFDGFEYFKCAACELGAIKDGPQTDNDFDALDAMKEAALKGANGQNNSTFKAADGTYSRPEESDLTAPPTPNGSYKPFNGSVKQINYNPGSINITPQGIIKPLPSANAYLSDSDKIKHQSNLSAFERAIMAAANAPAKPIILQRTKNDH